MREPSKKGRFADDVTEYPDVVIGVSWTLMGMWTSELYLCLTGVSQIDRVVEVVEETLKGNKVRLFGKKALPRLDLPKVRRNKHVEIVPLSTGCLGR